ncbi:MAG TPA: GNAT family N-acetyltransferase [Candidatus Coprovivens excrementavium]|nr:GNAT family N-acetyltransferase [Candidatus Coprovivens excrementavium]
MQYLGSQELETKNLLLKAQTFEEQKKLWEILLVPEVNRYYLTIPRKFKDKLFDWDKQKEFYEKEMLESLNNDIFKWSIFLKENGECIGRVTCQETNDENRVPEIRDVSWYIDPKYQGCGFGYEAAKAMLDFMFFKCNIEKIITCAAVCNPASWKLMEKLGFKRKIIKRTIQYTFLDEETECYVYEVSKDEYIKFNETRK